MYILVLTPKQKDVLGLVRRLSKENGMAAMEVGLYFGQPRKKAEKWAKPALKELIKQKLVVRDSNTYRYNQDV